jgi:hypothetical protein
VRQERSLALVRDLEAWMRTERARLAARQSGWELSDNQDER